MSKPKLKKKSPASKSSAVMPGLPQFQSRALIDSAREIWMAGLGAFGRAQEEGSKLFERLVREGMNLEQKTRRFATGQVDGARDAVENTVANVRERATDTWDKLEKVFEDRVSNALKKLGVPGREEMEALLERVEELNREVRKSQVGRTSTAKKAAPRKSAPSAKSEVRKAKRNVGTMADGTSAAPVAKTKTPKRAAPTSTSATKESN